MSSGENDDESASLKIIPIVVPEPQPVHASTDVLKKREEERLRIEVEKLKARAEKFGVQEVADPIPGVTVPLQRKFRKPKEEAFPVGFDVFAGEEQVKKELRLHRFGLKKTEEAKKTEEPVLQVEDDSWKRDTAKRESREARFGAVKREAEGGAVQETEQKGSAKNQKKQKKRWKLPRKDPGTAPLRPDTIYVHGCDALNTKAVFGFFRLYGPSSMEWINDSSCNVTFADEYSAKRALMNLGTREDEPDSPWFSFGDGRSLRVATEADVKATFFEAQPPEERKLKEKRFGPALAKQAGKRAKEYVRVVERLAEPLTKSEEKEPVKELEESEGAHEIVVVQPVGSVEPAAQASAAVEEEIDIEN